MVIAEDKFLVEKAKGIWMGEPGRTVKRTSKAAYLGTRCTQDGGFSVELAHRLNPGNRAWIQHRARLTMCTEKQWTRAMRLEAFFGLVVPAIYSLWRVITTYPQSSGISWTRGTVCATPCFDELGLYDDRTAYLLCRYSSDRG